MQHYSAYDPLVTELCERALVTVIGNAGFWGRHLYLVGGLAAGYLTREAPVPRRTWGHATSISPSC